MAITQTGSTLRLTSGSSLAETGTFVESITVPADAEIAIVGVTAYTGDGNGLAAMTLTKGGVDTAMTRLTGGDVSGSQWQSALFYLMAPDTGSGKALKWDWAAGSDTPPLASVTFWKGIDTTTPVRDSDGVQGGSSFPKTTPTLVAESGDLIVAFFGGYTGGSEGSVDTWSNVSTLSSLAADGYTDIAWGSGSPSGDTTVGVTAVTAFSEGALVAAVLRPVGSSGDETAGLASQVATVSGGSVNVRIGAIIASVTFDDHATSEATLDDNEAVTFSLTAAATLAGEERLVVLSGAGSDITAWTFDAVSVDGQPAVPVGALVRGPAASGATPLVSLWRAPGTANTAIDVVATANCPSGNIFVSACACFRLVDGGDLLAQAGSVSNDPHLDVETMDDGVVVAAMHGFAEGSPSALWTGLTEHVDTGISGNQFTTACANVAFEEVPRLIRLNLTYDLDEATDSVAAASWSFVRASFVPSGAIRVGGQPLSVSVGTVSVTAIQHGYPLEAGNTYYVTATLGPSDSVTLDTAAPFADGRPFGYENWYGEDEIGVDVTVTLGGQQLTVSTGSVTVGEEEIPVTPSGGGGGAIPRKQLRKAVRELLKREEKRKGRKKPKVLAREILEAIEAKGLGVQEKRLAIRLIGEALRLELPSLFYSQPIIRDKEQIARAILFVIERAMQRILDEEEDEEAALLLLSAA